MEYGVEDFGLPCPPWEDYAAATFDNDHHSMINLQPVTFFDGLNEDDDDVGSIDHNVICSKEIKVQSKSSCIIKHGRGKELRTAIRVLKPTANQLAAAYQLLDKKKNKDNATTSSNILDDQPRKKLLIMMMNKKGTRSINLDQPKKLQVLVATKVMKTTKTTPPPNSIHKDDRPKILMKMATQKEEAAIKKSSTTTTHEDKDDKPKTVVLERKKETVAAKHLNNNINGPIKDDQKVLPRDEFSMQLKFESAKRKLHDSYERINNAKKHRSIQVIAFQKPPLPNPKARSSYRAKYPRNNFHQPAAILQHYTTSYK